MVILKWRADVERRLNALESQMPGLATKEQVDYLRDDISDLKGMIQELLDNRAGKGLASLCPRGDCGIGQHG
jgi:hypothetical protein